MLFWGRVGADGARNGRVSSKYMRMNPKIRDMPIQAWEVRLGCGCSKVWVVVVVVLVVLSLLRMPTSPGPVGVTGGVFGEASGSMPSVIVPPGMTGPGRALIGFAIEIPSRLKGTASPSRVSPERWRNVIIFSPPEFLWSAGAWGITLLRKRVSPL